MTSPPTTTSAPEEMNRRRSRFSFGFRRSSTARKRKHHMIPYQQSVATFDPDKKKNTILRWNLLWTVLVIGFGLAPNWINFAAGPRIGWAIIAICVVVLDVAFWLAALLVWPSLYKQWKQYKNTSPKLRHLPTTELDSNKKFVNKTGAAENYQLSIESGAPALSHLVVMVGYNEPIELICKTVDTVAAQTRAKNIVMVIGLEERTKNYAEKIEFFENRYEDCFLRLIQTVHPFGLKGEIPGTCSNANWAIRQATTYMRDQGLPFDPDTTLLTKLDTDTLFLPTHFEILEREFLALPQDERTSVMFQSALTYNLALDERGFFARVTGILRTFFMLGFLIPFNINTMSIYSLSLSLARKADYWLPHYQMEDIIQNLHLMVGAGKRVPIKLLPLPTVSGPTSGESFWEEFSEWRLQARRWTIGAAEVFHYYVTKLIGKNFDLRSGVSFGLSFVLYYGFILCVTGLFQLCAIWGAGLNGGGSDLSSFPYTSPNTLFPTLLGIKYVLVFGTAFAADIIHRQITGVQEKTLGLAGGVLGVTRSVLHYLSSLIVLLAYNLVEAMAIIELTYRGREICGHVASKKGALATKQRVSVVARRHSNCVRISCVATEEDKVNLADVLDGVVDSDDEEGKEQETPMPEKEVGDSDDKESTEATMSEGV